MSHLFINRGNVQDIRCSLQHGFNGYTVADFEKEIRIEIRHRNRTSVLSLLDRAINALNKGKTHL